MIVESLMEEIYKENSVIVFSFLILLAEEIMPNKINDSILMGSIVIMYDV